MNWAQLKDPVSHMCRWLCGSILVSYTRAEFSETFRKNSLSNHLANYPLQSKTVQQCEPANQIYSHAQNLIMVHRFNVSMIGSNVPSTQ